jgi:hypothetical protein
MSAEVDRVLETDSFSDKGQGGTLFEEDWDWHHEANSLLESGSWEEAEEIYVSVGEVTQEPRHASSAINSLVFSILIPQTRFVEARIWLEDSMNLEVVYESWNSLENLGLCEYFAGNNELAELHLLHVVQAEEGPVKEARAWLEKIRAGKFAKPVPKPDLRYTEEWKDVDVSGPIDPRATQREFYLRLIKYLSETNQEFDLDLFEQSRGGSITGFVNGLLSNELIEMGFGRDAAAKSCLDYISFVQKRQDPDEDHFDTGLELFNQGETYIALKKLRMSAREGNPEAMLLVANGVSDLYGPELALPWFRLAAANGIQEAVDFLNPPASVGLGAKFCTECGSARAPMAKFCVNCGNRFA